jgi:hypothetical protein
MALWNNTDADASKPKYLSDTLRNGQSVSDFDGVLGIDVTEAQAAANIAKGLNTPGWVAYTTYTDAQGNTRNKSEVLVAMKSLTGDNDTLAPEITIGTQPTNQSATAPATATFSVVASRTGTGTLTYQWQIQQEGTGSWANVTTGTGGTSASYTTGATATGDGAGATDGDKYRVIVSLTGAQSVTSTAVTLTVV